MSSRPNDNDNKSRRGWVDKNNHYERHYCEVCNVWMGSDKASILTHRNGKKHVDNTTLAQSKKSNATAAQEKQQLAMQASLKQMEVAAHANFQQDYCLFADGSTPVLAHLTTATFHNFPTNGLQSSSQILPPIHSSSDTHHQPVDKHERKEWDDRKKQRDLEKRLNRKEQDNTNDNTSGPNLKRRKITIGKNDGHYSVEENVVWLHGATFGEILEEDMPVQIWLGNAAASETEFKLPENQRYWKDGLIVAIRTRQLPDDYEDRMVVDVAFLEKPDDLEEQLKKSLRLRHIRILLGNIADDRIPTTLDEARVLAMGGEVIQPTNQESQSLEIDESTGLSSWSTVHVNRTSIRNELKAERDLMRKERKEATVKAEKAAKEAEMRRMEEAKTLNADDSALGAYDIWGRTKDGYKGVQIHAAESSLTTTAANVSVHDFGKKLAMGGVHTEFKSKSNLKNTMAKKRQNRRTTSADDD